MILVAAVLPLQAQGWVLADREPLPRQGHALVPAPGLDRLLCLGGNFDSPATTFAMERIGRQWHPLAAAGPSDRAVFAAAVDPVRGRTVLFGGYGNLGYLGDHWEFDGTAWTQRTFATAPLLRAFGAMCWHGGSSRIVLYGGQSSAGGNSVLGETWTFDGNTWRQLQPVVTPGERMRHAMVYDSVRDRVVLFGGESYTAPQTGTWEWDGVGWTQTASVGPSPRWHPAMAYDPDRQRTVLFGGYDQRAGTVLADTWLYDGSAWTQVQPTTVPPVRLQAAMAFDPQRRRVVLLGGYAPRPLGTWFEGDTWEWDGSDWSRADASSRPVGGIEETFCSAPDGAGLLLENNGSYNLYDSTWRFEGGRWQQLPATTLMPIGGVMTLDQVRGEVLLFGGRYQNLTNSTYVFAQGGWQQRYPALAPSPRRGHALASDLVRGRVVLFGGQDALYMFGDTWEWDGTQWALRANLGPSVRYDSAMAPDLVGGGLLLFGGHDGVGVLGDTWRWDGTSWQSVTAGGPAARSQHAMAQDLSRVRVVMVGGYDATYAPRHEEWNWNGASWQFVGPIPAARQWHLGEAAGNGPLRLKTDYALFVATPAPASTATYGAGCAGAAGVPRLDCALLPVLGRSDQEIVLDRARAGAFALLLADFAGASVPFGACTQLLAAPTSLMARTTGSTGTATWLVPVPAQPALSGMVVFWQAVVVDPQGALGGVAALSNGLRLQLGD